MLIYVITVTLVTLIHVVALSLAASLTYTWLVDWSVVPTVLLVILVWLSYLYLTDFLTCFLFKAKKEKMSLENELIIQNFSFRNKDLKVSPLFSSSSPAITRVSVFDKSNIIINKNFIADLTGDEVNALLDVELSYYSSFSGLLEVLITKLYLLIWFLPSVILLTFLNVDIVKFVMSPLRIFFEFVIKSLRVSYRYSGLYTDTVHQVIFKVRLRDINKKRFKMFYISEQNMQLMTKGNSKNINTERFNISGI